MPWSPSPAILTKILTNIAVNTVVAALTKEYISRCFIALKYPRKYILKISPNAKTKKYKAKSHPHTNLQNIRTTNKIIELIE